MYKIFLINHGYFTQHEFDTFQAVMNWVKARLCFEVSVWHDDEMVATWSPISGTTTMNDGRRLA